MTRKKSRDQNPGAFLRRRGTTAIKKTRTRRYDIMIIGKIKERIKTQPPNYVLFNHLLIPYLDYYYIYLSTNNQE